MTVRITLLVGLGALALYFAVSWARAVARRRAEGAFAGEVPSPPQLATGFVTNFFDTLGIGSFATTTTAYKILRMVPDEHIPGTMIVGHALPVVAQALIFIAIVRVEATVLLSLVLATIAGGWLGAGIVSNLPRRSIQIGMGTALFLAATFMVMSQVGLFPGGGTALGLPPVKLAIAIAVNFVLGALIMLGIGNYGPCLILLSLLGMDPRAAFPIMMSAGGMVAMVGGLRFMKTGRYDLRAALGLAIGGIPAVLLAGLVVKSLPLDAIRWLVVIVVVYAAVMLLRSALTRTTGTRIQA
ncbi:MAG: permease [Gemmatimonadaceae bacterium]